MSLKKMLVQQELGWPLPEDLDDSRLETTRAQIRAAMRAHPVQQRSLTEYAALRDGDAGRTFSSTPRDHHEEDAEPSNVEGGPQAPL